MGSHIIIAGLVCRSQQLWNLNIALLARSIGQKVNLRPVLQAESSIKLRLLAPRPCFA